jgi:hypothetical protein
MDEVLVQRERQMERATLSSIAIAWPLAVVSNFRRSG